MLDPVRITTASLKLVERDGLSRTPSWTVDEVPFHRILRKMDVLLTTSSFLVLYGVIITETENQQANSSQID